ncbi:MAG: PadR family transcriptional regulator [Candidatus Taylorbacteria bacterium]
MKLVTSDSTPTLNTNLVDKKIADLRMVLLDYFIIKMIIFSSHSMYGKEILQKLKALGLSSKEGTIYPLLSKLRRENLMSHSYEESDVGPPRKYYYVTDQGRHYFTEIQRLLQGL